MNVIIIDDELYARKALEDNLKKYCPDINIVAIEDSGQTGFTAINELNPDLVFLDIAMPLESGFDMLNRFEEINFEIIFVTGFNEYAINAIEFSAIGYILKPIDPEELIKSIHNAKRRIETKSENQRIRNLLSNLKTKSPKHHKIAIASMNSIDFIPTLDIIRFEGMEKLTTIQILGNKKMVSSQNIGEFRKLLEEHGFYAPHKSHLININHISKYLKEGTIIMSDGSYVPVSKRRKTEFIKLMKTI